MRIFAVMSYRTNFHFGSRALRALSTIRYQVLAWLALFENASPHLLSKFQHIRYFVRNET